MACLTGSGDQAPSYGVEGAAAELAARATGAVQWGMAARSYRYVGPEHVRAAAAGAAPGAAIRDEHDLERWLRAHASDREGGAVPATFVVSLEGELRLASRRSEHVACAGGQPVLSAGELFFADGRAARVVAASNLSTGYCPEPASWASVAAALERAGIRHPGRFTAEFVFRRCVSCGERNLVKDDHFVCAICGAELPPLWNFA